MPLTNQQYDSIFREYEEKQNRSRRNQLRKITEIYKKIPEYEEVEHSISSVCVAQTKKLLDGSDSALVDLKRTLHTLSEKKRSLLLSAGYPENYLEPEYDCPYCKDTGYIDGQKCICLKQRIISLLYEQSNIKEVLTKENFSTLSYAYYEGEDLRRFQQTVAACESFVQNFSSEYRNLFFYGSVGAGKSFLSNCIAKELIENGRLVLYFSAAGLLGALSGKSREEQIAVAHDLYGCDLLVIDDLGTEYTNAYVISQLFSCLNERHLRRKSTLISTNLSLEDLRNRYSERIFSRVTSNYEIHKITGPDIRMYRKTMMNRK
ncbi:MAG: ATP-binding protein [Lachnospiraceae bacterium]|nr:ATP-binding protein [Lachnospiraceae bacterium]